MTPEELAGLHPRLYHVTTPGAWAFIARHGLLPPVRLVDLFGDRHDALLAQRRGEVTLRHAVHGTAILNDNKPLSMTKLGACLDDGLTADDWLGMLNERVFFWVNRHGFERLLGARANRTRARDVLVFDTLSLARAHADRMELSPINSGSTIHKPARRGLATFSPLLLTNYAAWRRQRPKSSLDTITEIVVRGGVPNIERHFLGVQTADGISQPADTP